MKEVSPHSEADGAAMHPPTTGSGWGCGFSLPLGLEAIKNVRLGNKHPSFPPFRGERERLMSPPVPRKKERKSDVTKSCLTLCDPMDCSLPRLLHPRYFPGKNTGVGCHFLLQGDLSDPGIKPGSPALQADFLWPEPPGAPIRSPTRHQLNRTKPLQEAEIIGSIQAWTPPQRPLSTATFSATQTWLKDVVQKRVMGKWGMNSELQRPQHSLLTPPTLPPHLPRMAWPRNHVQENKSDKSSLQVLPKYGHLILFPLKSKQLGETAAHVVGSFLHCAVLNCSVVSNSVDPMDCSPLGSSVHGILQARILMSCHALFQGIIPTQGSNPGFPHCRHILYHLSHQGSSRILEWVAYSFSRGSSRPRNQTSISHIVRGFFTSWPTKEAQFLH